MQNETAVPKKTLSLIDGVALVVGIVVGTGIFKTPSLVAANTGSDGAFFLAWILGGAVSLIGALCYAELAAAYPHAGGDYHYLRRAFGKEAAFLFGWARMTVIQPGSIALLAFVFGDYLAPLLPPVVTPSLCAVLAVAALTAANVMGTRKGTVTQNVLTLAKVVGLFSVLLAGLAFAPPLSPAGGALPPAGGSFGLAMVFVLLTFGGWNEAAYISAELQQGERNMIRVLLGGVAAITALYLVAGAAYLTGLGIGGMSASEVVAADLMRKAFGDSGAGIVSLLIAVAALGAINATIFTGARTSYAVGRDFALFSLLGRWRQDTNTPATALLVQGVIAAVLVLMGAVTRRGFETMVEFTAPVFWLFFLLTGVAFFLLRRREPGTVRPFKVPLYPLVPALFCCSCGYMLHASLRYTGSGAAVGLGLLCTGGLVLAAARCHQRRKGEGI